MKKNVLFILIDGLRADQCFGEASGRTDFFDKLISRGIVFKNTFSSADGTFISLNCLFNSKFQFENNIERMRIFQFEKNLID